MVPVITEVYHLQTQEEAQVQVLLVEEKLPLQFPQVLIQMNCTIIVLHIPPWLVLMDSK